MRGRKNPMPNNQSASYLPPCKVCGAPGTGFHYGVTTCGACKGFFRRSLLRKEPYVCVESGNCPIGPDSDRRKCCPKCRHDKCLSVGMSKDAIKTGRYSYEKKSKDVLEVMELREKLARSPLSTTQIPGIHSECVSGELREVNGYANGRKSEGLLGSSHQSQATGLTTMAGMEDDAFVSQQERTFQNRQSLTVSSDLNAQDVGNSFAMTGKRSVPQSRVVELDDLPPPCMSYTFVNKDLKRALKRKLNGKKTENDNIQKAETSDSSQSSMTTSVEGTESCSPGAPPTPDLGSTWPVDAPAEGEPLPDLFETIATQLCPSHPAPISLGPGIEAESFSSSSGQCCSNKSTRTPFTISSSLPLHPPAPPPPQLTSDFSASFTHPAPCYNNLPLTPAHLLDLDLSLPPVPETEEMPSFEGIKNQACCLSSDLFIPDGYEFPPLSAGIHQSEYRSVMSPTFCTLADEVEENICDLDCDFPEPTGGNTDASAQTENVQNVDSESSKTELPIGSLEWRRAEAIRQIDNSYDEVISLAEDLSKCQFYSYEMTLLGPIFNKLCISGPQKKAVSGSSTDQQSDVAKQASMQHDSQSHTISQNIPMQSNSPCHTNGHQAHMQSNSQYHTMSQQTPPLPDSQYQSNQTFAPSGISYPTPLPSATPLSTTHSTGFSPHPNHHRLSGSPSSSRSPPQSKPARSEQRFCEADYNKPLPWCEFSEGHLDDVASMLMEAHEKHIGKDMNSVSREEIAEKSEIYLKLCRLKERVFGRKTLLQNREEYYEILENTGVDIDGRKEWAEVTVKVTNDVLFKVVRFVKSVPGFRDLCKDDKIVLCRSSMVDCFFLGSFRGIDLRNHIIINEMNLASNVDECLGIIPEYDANVAFYSALTKRLQAMDLTLEEVILLKAICITSPDRDGLKERRKVEALYWRFLCCLLLSLHRRHPKPYSVYSQVITLLADLKTCVIVHHQLLEVFKVDIVKLTSEIDAPLYKEMMLINHPATAK
ncbi:uncharacterized protein LOC101849296 [Aplysia californica]|uniref:Uncharacterized protein LOC101849296 n=1 Tax=Aplysia californica TaxID=6500 RepID=A0ABM0JT19_APLCA|nr:uncharacterized protein LOC101849296 [Aplysia californica]